ncbi:hypothetical protein SARC_14726, partial [Sphaeroforma arctica JP610]
MLCRNCHPQQSIYSVASPLVAGAVALLLSGLTVEQRLLVNPTSVKQILIESAIPIKGANLFQQGSGQLNLFGAHDILRTYTPHLSTVPSRLDFSDCPYLWPYCAQPLYCSGMGHTVNVTVLNALSVNATFGATPVWIGDEKAAIDVLE